MLSGTEWGALNLLAFEFINKTSFLPELSKSKYGESKQTKKLNSS